MTDLNWRMLYDMVGGLTPLRGEDCGRICRKKCCSLTDEGSGVFLFPGEETLYRGVSGWYSLGECLPGMDHFTGGSPRILICRGKCEREERPLACRLFPLAPYLDEGDRLKIVFDQDALFTCPLVRLGDYGALDPEFGEAVRRVWAVLLEDGGLLESVRKYSARADREAGEPWTKLLGK